MQDIIKKKQKKKYKKSLVKGIKILLKKNKLKTRIWSQML